MDFAPYQAAPPEHGRTISPPDSNSSPRTSWEHGRRSSYSPGGGNKYQQRPAQVSPPPLLHPQPHRAWSGEGISRYQSPGVTPGATNGVGSAIGLGSNGSGGGVGGGMGEYFNALGAREGMVSEFDTSLGLRLDYEACLAYLAVPPLGAILLLILERKSDYVR